MADYVQSPYLDVFHSEFIKNARFSDKYEFPIVAKSESVATKAIPFHNAAATSKFDQWVHFYIHDYRFERIWNNPEKYLGLLKKFEGVISPDFSLYWDMPLAMQIWNTYRNRAIGHWLQQNGINVIPNVRWGDERTFDFVFEGLEQGGTVAISTNGCIRNKLQRYNFKKGLSLLVEKIKPETIVNYSNTPDDIFGIYKKEELTSSLSKITTCLFVRRCLNE